MVVQEIKEIQQLLQLKFLLRMAWVDARLDFFNIKLDGTMNVISLEELNRIWLPIIVFHNTEEGQITINDGKSFATINRPGKGLEATKASVKISTSTKGLKTQLA